MFFLSSLNVGVSKPFSTDQPSVSTENFTMRSKPFSCDSFIMRANSSANTSWSSLLAHTASNDRSFKAGIVFAHFITYPFSGTTNAIR